MSAPVVLCTRWGDEVLLDQEDADALAPLFAAGVTLRVRRDRHGGLQAFLHESRAGGERVTLCLAKVLMRAGPRDQPIRVSPYPLDYRKASWRVERMPGIVSWNSKLLGVDAVRGPGNGS